VEAVDRYTLRIYDARANRRPARFAGSHCYFAWRAAKEYPRRTPGTGPYSLEHVQEGQISLRAWEGYWGEAPVLKKLVFRALQGLWNASCLS